MAHSLSARKRVRQNEKHRAVNRWRKRRIHDAIREFEEIVHKGDVAEAEKAFKAAASTLDRVATKGSIHRNKASRKKARLAKRLNALKASKGG